ncbi:MAG: DUF502 domain-containing protein [Bdellovibrionales bacterium]|nr:DUF502 domain-containing protein [Bdellovibrionales bacterium]
MKLAKLQNIIKEHFLSGLLVLAPILIVGIVFQWIFGGLLSWIENVPLHWFFEDFGGLVVAFVRLLIMFGIIFGGIFVISSVGFFSRLYFGRKLFQWLKEGIEKIPFFGAIYSSLDQLFSAISSSGGKQFNRVVFIEYPRKEVWAVAFVTGDADFKGIPQGYISVFVPTVPNPTSGFHLMVRESEVKESGLKVDEAFKLILSLGVAAPHHEEPVIAP